ncbi:MAG: lipase maturation factor family protein [Chloroflexi bacterium]|nr:MAG: lipase maturation factor family protein [Chloroflexota bacterium]TMF37790.1 MAG: lipase maturation factor family protein [Chloroflexota bacterium]
MDWLQAPDYWLTRLLIERALGMIYLVAFLVAAFQFRPLLGAHGLLPVPLFLRRVRFLDAPTLFHLHYSDPLLLAVAWGGVLLSIAVVVGLPDVAPPAVAIPIWFALWALYQSIVNVGQIFYAFGWETLLLEAGFLAIFLGAGPTVPPWPLILLLRWLVFRVEFGAGLIKLRGDRCWREGTCLYYHHETQPMPNSLSWFFHHLPRPLHRIEVLGNFFAQLVVPFFLFAPQPVASIAGAIIVLTQAWLVLSGNFSWLNFLTMTLAFSAFDDRTLSLFLSVHAADLAALPLWWQWLVLAVTVLVIVLSYRPVLNLISPHQLMNFSFDPFHLVNTYGAFGSVTKERYEIVVEGTADHPLGEAGWKAYEFKGKPGDPRRIPRQFAPYHLRLDWLMWFAAMESPFRHQWLIAFVVKLLEGDRATSKLLRFDPFRGHRPVAVRANLYRYRFSTWDELRRQGVWWVRTPAGEYLPTLVLDPAGAPAQLHRE